MAPERRIVQPFGCQVSARACTDSIVVACLVGIVALKPKRIVLDDEDDARGGILIQLFACQVSARACIDSVVVAAPRDGDAETPRHRASVMRLPAQRSDQPLVA